MNTFLCIGGALIILVVIQDVFFTVLFPASGHGLIRKPLAHLVWCAFGLAARMTTGQRRRNLLSYSGPVLITVALAAWLLLLVVGWAMIYKPGLGTSIRASSGATGTGWATALYYSGFNLTTLGVGDVVPTTGLYRLLTVIEAMLGFVFFSMVTTYFLSVYSSLIKRNAFAQGLYHGTQKTNDAAEFLARLADGPELLDARQRLSAIAGFLRQIYQTHRSYPVLSYFHYREPYYALPRVLFTVLDTVTLVSTALDKDRYSRLVDSPALDEVFEAALALMRELIADAPPRQPTEEDAALWRKRYLAAIARLAGAGLHVRADTAAGAEAYIALRTAWDRSLHDLAAAMFYEWEVGGTNR